jgi:Domain of unknown function (DUF4352)
VNRHIAVGATAVVAVLGLAACQPTQTVNSKPDSGHSSTAKGKPAAKPKQAAGIGDTITVTGQNGERLAITLKKWAGTTKPGDQFETPDKGKRWAAAQFQIVNVGKAVYSDSPDNCVQAADSQGQHFDTTLATSITAGPVMTSDLKLAPGDKALGWVVVEVPKSSKVASLQYTPDSGFSDSTAEWTIK